LAAAIQTVDERIDAITSRVAALGIHANFVIVSDHGMTPIAPERVILLDELIKPEDVQLDFDGPLAGLRPLRGDVADLIRRLAPLQHAKAYRWEALPARFHLSANPRIPPVWIVPEEGWEIYFRKKFDSYAGRFNHGDHGYDPAFRSMHGIFIANGPSFRRGAEIPETDNIHLYNLLCAVLGLKPAPNDGDDRLVKAALR
jgi:predicted AlkP superfamily pyrophosphatase or phosphodiesterase